MSNFLPPATSHPAASPPAADSRVAPPVRATPLPDEFPGDGWGDEPGGFNPRGTQAPGCFFSLRQPCWWLLLAAAACLAWLARGKAVGVSCRGRAFPAGWRRVNSCFRVASRWRVTPASPGPSLHPLRGAGLRSCPGLTRRENGRWWQQRGSWFKRCSFLARIRLRLVGPGAGGARFRVELRSGVVEPICGSSAYLDFV